MKMLTVDSTMIIISSVSLTLKKMSSSKEDRPLKETCLLVSKRKAESITLVRNLKKRCRERVTGTQTPRSRSSLVTFATTGISLS